MVKIIVGIDGMACGMCEAHIHMRKRGCFRGGRHETEKIGGGLFENNLYPFQK